MWLACHTQEEIAEAVKCTQQAISEVIQKQFCETEIVKPSANHLTDFDPPIYNVWTKSAKTNSVSHYCRRKASTATSKAV